jgi:hypothetical protein
VVVQHDGVKFWVEQSLNWLFGVCNLAISIACSCKVTKQNDQTYTVVCVCARARNTHGITLLQSKIVRHFCDLLFDVSGGPKEASAGMS